MYTYHHISVYSFAPAVLGFIPEICVYNSWKIVDHCHLINKGGGKKKGGDATMMGYMYTLYTYFVYIVAVRVCCCDYVQNGR